MLERPPCRRAGCFGIALAAILIGWMKMPAVRVLLVSVAGAVAAILFGEQPLLPFALLVIGLSWITSTDKGEGAAWFASSWDYAKKILPLLLIGVLIAGALLGRPGQEGLIPSEWVAWAVGGNSLAANFFAAFAGAFMYFATLTEVPIVQGLIGNGMGEGPALAVPESLTVFDFPAAHRIRLRTTNGLERINRELRRRTRVASIFPNTDSCLRLLSALLAELDDDWMTGKLYLNLNP